MREKLKHWPSTLLLLYAVLEIGSAFAMDKGNLERITSVENSETDTLVLKFDFDTTPNESLPQIIEYMITDSVRLEKLQKNLRSLKIDTERRRLGFLPAWIGKFKALKRLDISGIYIEQLPTDIGLLENLEILNVENNCLSSITPEIEKLTTLKALQASNNKIESISADFWNLKNLEQLHLSSNRLEFIPREICKLVNLESLSVHGNKLATLPSELAQLKKLKNLQIFNNPIHYENSYKFLPLILKDLFSNFDVNTQEAASSLFQTIPFAINPKIVDLIDKVANNESTELILSRERLNDDDIAEIFRYIKDDEIRWKNIQKNLKNFSIASNNITIIPQEISSFSELKFLDISGNHFSSFPEKFSKLDGLITLQIVGCSLESLPDNINLLKNLEILDMSNNHFRTFPPPKLEELTKLKIIIANSNAIKSITSDIQNFKMLTELNLDYNSLSSLPLELGNLSALESLSLKYTNLSSFPSELRKLKHLKKLDFPEYRFKFIPIELKDLLIQLGTYNKHSSLIQQAPFALSPQITDLINQVENKETTILDLTKKQITDDDLKEIFRYMKRDKSPWETLRNNLETLLLSDNFLHTLHQDISEFKNLKKLDVSNNSIKRFPQELSELKLHELNISNNCEIFLPTEKLTELRKLDASKCCLKSLPSTISSLKKLENLNINGNKLSKIPLEIKHLNRLQSLQAENNALQSIPGEIGCLKSLILLTLKNNKIIEIPSDIGNLNKLEHFNLGHNGLLSIPQRMDELVALKFLNLSGNKISILPDIGNWAKLEFLNLSDNPLAKLPPEIGKLENLINFTVKGNIPLCAEMEKLKNLQKLFLDDSPTFSIPANLKKLFRRINIYTKYVNFFDYCPKVNKPKINKNKIEQDDLLYLEDAKDFAKLLLYQAENTRLHKHEGFTQFSQEHREKNFPKTELALDQFIEIVSKTTNDSHKIEYIRYSLDLNNDKKRPVIVYAHGGDAKNRKGELGMVAFHHYFINKGWIVIVPNFEAGTEALDIYDVAMHLRNGNDLEVDPKKIVLSGISAGSGVNFELLNMIGQQKMENPFAAVHFSSMVTENSLPDIVQNFPDIPYLLTHGQKDTVASVNTIIDLAKKMEERGLIHRLCVSPSGNHHMVNDELSIYTPENDPLYEDLLSYSVAIASFFKKVFDMPADKLASPTLELILKKLADTAVSGLLDEDKDDLSNFSSAELVDIINRHKSVSRNYLNLFLGNESNFDILAKLEEYYQTVAALNSQQYFVTFMKQVGENAILKREMLKAIAREVIYQNGLRFDEQSNQFVPSDQNVKTSKMVSYHAAGSNVIAMYAFYSITHGIANCRSIGMDCFRGQSATQKYLNHGPDKPINRQVADWQKKRPDGLFNEMKKYGDQTLSQAPVIFAGNASSSNPLSFLAAGGVGKLSLDQKRMTEEIKKILKKMGIADYRYQKYIDLITGYSDTADGHGLIQFFPEPILFDRVSNLTEPRGVPYASAHTPSSFMKDLWERPEELQADFAKTKFTNQIDWDMFNDKENRNLLFSAVQFRTLSDPQVTLSIPKHFYLKNRDQFNIFVQTLKQYFVKDLSTDYLSRREDLKHFNCELEELKNLDKVLETFESAFK